MNTARAILQQCRQVHVNQQVTCRGKLLLSSTGSSRSGHHYNSNYLLLRRPQPVVTCCLRYSSARQFHHFGGISNAMKNSCNNTAATGTRTNSALIFGMTALTLGIVGIGGDDSFVGTTAMASKDEKSSKNKDEYTLPSVWKDEGMDGTFGRINRPTAGAQFEKELPVGKHPFQLYSLGTPNGQKVTIMLEELLELGHVGAEYDAWLIKIFEGAQFGSGFVKINPNSKIPAMVDNSVKSTTGQPIYLFESGSMLLYLAEKFNTLLPSSSNSSSSDNNDIDTLQKKTQVMNWVFWQIGSAPFVGGGFGHFFNYAPYKMKYPIDRYTMETKRQLDVLEKHLSTRTYMVGEEYTIADIAIWPWYGQLVLDKTYPNAAKFLNVEQDYPNVIRWAKMIAKRPAVKRGMIVNRVWGPLNEQLPERHDASDFETKTMDKVEKVKKENEVKKSKL